ncbi:MAG: hypothetical protein ACRYGR_02890 [Janthinobacterium lividum]
MKYLVLYLILSISKLYAGSERLKSCLTQEINDITATCLYTDKIIEEIKKLYSVPLTQGMSEYTKRFRLACKVRNSNVCFDEAIFYAFAMRNNFIKFYKKSKEKKISSVSYVLTLVL